MAVEVQKVKPQEMQALIERVEHAIAHDLALDAEDMRLLLDAIHTLINVQSALTEKDATLLKLKKLLGMVRSSENRKSSSKKRKYTNKDADSKPPATEPEVHHHEVQAYKSGDPCPSCANGILGKRDPVVSRRVQAQQPYKVVIHILKRLACSRCNFVVTASLPEEVKRDGDEEQVYGYSARSMMAIHKHFSGTPFYHQQNLNTLFGCPITASTISDQCNYVADDVRLAYQQTRHLAANAFLFYIDDTHHRILDAKPKMKDVRNGKGTRKRTGIYTSGLIAVMSDGRKIYLYDTSLGHSGEHLDDILKFRDPSLPPPIISCDALSSNRPTVMECIVSLCNAHGRRQFFDTESFHPEVSEVLDDYDKIWVHDSKSKALEHSPAQRLAYHKEYSLTVMEKIQRWCQTYLSSEEVEEHGPLGKACRYFLKHYEELIQFCKTEGAPIDNNLMEAGLKLPIRGRKQSHFYKTEHGASVANILVSLIATAYQNGFNAFHYLNALQRNKSKISAERTDWLPWAVPASEMS